MNDGVLIVSATSKSGLDFFQHIRQGSESIRLLDFRPQYSKWLSEWCSEADMVHLEPKKSSFIHNPFVRSCAGAIIFEDDFVETALLTQTLKEAGVHYIHVVTQDAKRPAVYTKLGATYAGQNVPSNAATMSTAPMAG